MAGTPEPPPPEPETLQSPSSPSPSPSPSPPPPPSSPPPEPVSQEIADDDDDDDDSLHHQDMEVDMVIAPPTPAPPPPPPKEEAEEDETKPLPTPARKTTGKKPKTKPLTHKQRVVAEEKLRDLANLDPQPFVPTSVDVDVLKYERVLRLLGLWDFANLRMDREIRKDLIVELIAYYDQANRRTFVKNMRVILNRMPLARALGLPEKKVCLPEVDESDRGLFDDPGTKSALVKFLLGWVVLVGEVGIIPDEGQAAIWMIESGQANKVDWAGMLCGMVHREILNAPKSGVCNYASHLQRLMRHQKPVLFEEEEPSMEVPVAEEEEEEEVVMAVTDVGGMEKGGNLGEQELQDTTDFGLGLGGDGNMEEARQQQWLLGRRNEADGHCLRPCSTKNVQSMEFDVDANEGEHVIETRETCEDDFTSKFPNLDNSADLLQGMDAGNVSFIPSLQQPLDPSPGEFLASPIEAHKNMPSNYCSSGSSLFGNAGKRLSDKIDGEEEDGSDGGIQHFSHGGMAKRLRTDECWTPTVCMEHAMNWMEKARLMYTQKEQDIESAQVQLQYLTDLVQQKDQLIETLERSRLEEQHRMRLEISQFEHERAVMSHMVVGYQKVLRGTRQSFAEYRKKFPQGVEPLYKDVPGPGGGVLTAREFERQRLEKSESERQILEKMVLENKNIIKMLLNFCREWSCKFETHEEHVCRLDKRLDNLHGKMQLLKDHIVETKHSDEMELLKDHIVENKRSDEMKLLNDHIVENKHSDEMKLLKDHVVENKRSGEMKLAKDQIMENKHSDEPKLLKDHIVEKEHSDEIKPVSDDA